VPLPLSLIIYSRPQSGHTGEFSVLQISNLYPSLYLQKKHNFAMEPPYAQQGRGKINPKDKRIF
jgi:hypothetical protein